MPEPAPDPVALHDQAKAELVQKARVIGAYWKQLVAEGVDTWDATKLALALQRRLIFPDVVPAPDDDDADG